MNISVIVPTYNEEKHIENLLEWLVRVEPKNKEIFIVDGHSADHTPNIIEKYAKQNSNVVALTNDFKYVPYALNLAIQKCTGDIIVRIDAHTDYDDTYFIRIVETFNQTDADIVGGPMRAMGVTPFQKAVAIATSTNFGVGNSKFHDTAFKGYTDSVYLGAWKRGIFDRTGLFDTQMKRNQDDEFHYRAKSLGYKIYLNPEIISHYYPRENIQSLFRQYFQYGLYKPLVSKKIKSEIKLRHLIPLLFIIYLLCLPILIFVNPISILPLLFYLLVDLVYSFLLIKSNINIRVLVFFIFPTLHISYGLGYLAGIFRGLFKIFNQQNR